MPKQFSSVLLSLALLAVIPVQGTPVSEPQFRLGFRTLAELIPHVAGTPLEDERHHPINGDSLQVTSGGLMVWRKADNWTAFTDGWRTWVNGPFGLQARLNDVRFDWELSTSSEQVDDKPLPATSSPSEEFRLVSPGPSGETPGPVGTPPGLPSPVATPVWDPTATVAPFVASSATPVFAPSATIPAASSPTPVPTATRTTAVPSTQTPIPGGILSPEPAGAWVTSNSPGTLYYTSRENVSRWNEWAADHRVWFASEASLLAAYSSRARWDPPASGVSVATATPGRSATAAPVPGGIRSPDPSGEWVTSTAANTKYYTNRANSSVWGDWAAANRIWFNSEAALLAAYPGRTKR